MPVLEFLIRRLSAFSQHLRWMFVREPTPPVPELDLHFLEDRILYSGVALASELLAAQSTGATAGDFAADAAALTESPNPDALAVWGENAPSQGPSDSIAQIEASLQELDTLLAELTSQQTPQESDEGTTVDVPDISSEPFQFALIPNPDLSFDALSEERLQDAFAAASEYLKQLVESDDPYETLQSIFQRGVTESEGFEARAQAILEQIRTGGLGIEVELLSDFEMRNAVGAYAAIGHTGAERIYLNGSLIAAGLDIERLTNALLEEFGHALDARLNPGEDGRGDEGELFAAVVMGRNVSQEEREAIIAEDDHGFIAIDGVAVAVERSGPTLNGWQYRQQLVFSNASRAENLDDFPILVSINTTTFGSSFYSQAKANGADLRFLDGNGSSLAYEIQTWNTSGTSLVWVKVPRIDASSNSDSIFAFWGNASASDSQNAAGVWSNGYVGVWHLEQTNGAANSILDSTSYANHGTPVGIDSSNVVSIGAVGNAINFSNIWGPNGFELDYITLPSTNGDELTPQSLTLEAWAWRNYTDDGGSWRDIVARTSSGAGDSFTLSADGWSPNGPNDLTFWGTGGVTASNALAFQQWRYLAASRDTTGGNIYSNGVSLATLGGGNLNYNDPNVLIGGQWNGGTTPIHGWTGYIDEVRISNVKRSANWISAQYASMTGSLITYAGVTTVNQYSVGPVSDTNAAGNSVSENAASGTTVGITAYAVDQDTTNNTITYTLDNNAGGRFAINASTGVVTVSNGSLLNFESATSHTITVRATSADSSFSTANFTISLTDVDEFDVGAISDTNGAANSLAENSANGTAVGITASASDADGSNNTITYSLDNNAGGRFAINSSTGVVTVANSSLLNFESATSHTITVRASSSDGSASTANFTITLSDIDEFDVGAISDTNGAANSIAENSANGTAVGITASASDADATNNTITYSLDNNAGGRFAINSSTGVVTVANSTLLNFEAGTSHSITVRATSSDGSAATANYTVSVTDVDEFDVSAISDTNAAANSLAENSANGTAVGITASASDADGSNNTITYSLDNTAGGRFTINSSTGVVTVANSSLLDFESATSHTITVRASSSDGSASTANFTISLTNVNETPAAVADTATAVEAGGVSNGTAGTNPTGNVLTNDTDVDASDTKTVTGVAAGTVGSASTNVGANVTGTYGTINIGSTGAFTYTVDNSNATVQALRTTANTLTDVFTYTMRDAAGLTSTTQITVTIQGANDAPHDLSGSLTVAENSANGTSVGTITRSDVDSGDGASYSLVDSAGGRFAINSSTGVVTVANSSLLNREAAASHNITVRVTDTAGATYDEVFTVTVTDVDEFDVGAISDTNGAANSIAENSANGTAVGITASASDADATNNTITYSLDDSAGGRFAINSSTGVVTVANSTLLNFEAGTSHTITVRATSSDGSAATANYTVSVTDVDEFDVGAISDTNAAANSLAENSANGTAVGITASASDADGSNNTITYSLDNTAGGRFAINSSTGVVTVANSSLLDFESATSHTITVRASSSDGSFSTANFTISLTNVNETPSAVADTATAVEAGGVSNGTAGTNPTGNVLTNDTDVDAGDTKTVTGVAAGTVGSASTNVGSNVTGTYGTINIGSTGAFTYTVDNSNATVQALRTTANTLTDVFTYTMRDTAGLTSTTQITVTIQGANDAPHDLSGTLTVAENSANGTSVGTITRSDVDSGDGASYSLVDSAGGRFAINSATGVVTVANSSLLDRESAASHNITVRVTDTAGATYDEVFTVTVTDVDEFDVGAISDTNGAANSIAENSSNGTAVGITASASDADATNNTITYSLDNNAGGRFAINSSTGVVTVADSTLLNFESATSHAITVRATSSDGSFSTANYTISLTDVDEFDVGAISDTNAAANSLAENSANGTAVGITASASDADGSNNTITYSLDNTAGGRFSINSSTGVVTVANSSLLDFESATSHTITVRASSSDGSFSTANFTISLTDVDEFDVGAISDTNAAANSLAENSANGTAVGITASASDADGTNNTITYSLDDSAGGRFSINSSTGVVTVANSSLLNFESATSHSIIVRASSSDGSASTQSFTISLTDVDEFDVGSVSDANSATNNVAENAANGTTVGVTASASDADGSNNTITYSLDNNAGGRFAINGSTGVITVANGTLLDRESNASHTVTVRATSSDGSFSTTNFTIQIDDVDEFDITSINDTNAASNSLAENSANGSVVGITASASDADATNNTITYSLDNNASGRFAINSSTGVVTVANSGLLNFESASSHSITVRATSSDGSSTTRSFTISLTDVDEFDVGAVTDINGSSNTIAENVSNGTAVGITASASDADGTNNLITYTLDNSASGRFAINSSTGVVTVANSSLIDFESATNHTITVRATSSDGSWSTQAFTINITDINEHDIGSLIDADSVADQVAENAANGSLVGITALASDLDGSNSQVTYSLDNNAGGRFAINSTTGVVTVANGSLLNYESASSHTITVRAASADGSQTTRNFTISLSDVNEFDISTIADTNAASNSVAENAANGTTVGITASASDSDGTTNTITYSLDNSAGGRFAINSSTGVVSVANSGLLNFESATSHLITVRAASADGSFVTQQYTISLTDVDEFDVSPISDTAAESNTVAENAVTGTSVGIVAFANDSDGTNNTITYSLDNNAGGRFAVNGSTGIVSVANGTLLDYEAATSHLITVRATSTDGSFSTQQFTINLTDVDEFDISSISDTNASINSIAENASNGSLVGITASASDADGTNNTITYSLDNNAGGRFAINSTSGVVTVANGSLLNYEAATSHSITVRASSSDGSSSTQSYNITLTDVDEFDVSSASDTNPSDNAVLENAANGTTVGIIASASDADATNNLISYSLADDAGGRFAIHSSTGVITVANGSLLDREQAASHQITVRATSADGSTSNTVFTINLLDIDEFDIGAISDSNASLNTVAENSANGSSVGITASATDLDATLSTITYSLEDSAGGRFAIHSATGVVTVANGTLLNYESATSHQITVRATSQDGSTTLQNFTIALSDVDEFDVGPISDLDPTSSVILENSAGGTLVGITARAVDADATTNTITYSLDNSAGGRFAIDASTGVVTVAAGATLDREQAANYGIVIRATSADGSHSISAFNIELTDIDEFDVTSVSDTNPAVNSVSENASTGTLVDGLSLFAIDQDATNSTITYLLDDSAGGRFSINSATGAVSVANGLLLNYESATSHQITVRAVSSDGSVSAQHTVTIQVLDIDEFDVGAVTDANLSVNAINENSANGTSVGITASAVDLDGSNSVITYSLDDNAAGRFTIDSSTGVVRVANASLLDYESAVTHSVMVRATSADGSYSTQAFTISLLDVDEFDATPITDTNLAANSVAENAANGTLVGITAYSVDGDATNSAITYSLDDHAGGRFAIHGSTGVVTVANGALLNFETATSHSITVRASSADGSFTTATYTVQLSDVNEFDVTPITDTHSAPNRLNENSATGTSVGITAYSFDADGTTNAVFYSLDNDASGRFQIHASTGTITVANTSLLDYEAATSHTVTVRATSADGSSATASFVIDLQDVDEFDATPISDLNLAAEVLAENSIAGTLVGITARSIDSDGTTNTIVYSLDQSADGRFQIDAATGVVTVSGLVGLDFETANSHAITVRATSADGSFSTASYTIQLTDVDEYDVGPISDINSAMNRIAENSANGTGVGITARAVDADGTTNAIVYTLTDNAGGRFAIDSNSGAITVANGSLLNYENAISHTVTVLATSADGSFTVQSFTIDIDDEDEFDVSVITDADSAPNRLAENSANGTLVRVTASAVDLDGSNNVVTYSLVDDASGRFAINATTGVVRVANSSLLNYEVAVSHSITVRAQSTDGSSSLSSFNIDLNDVDEFDVTVPTDTNPAPNNIDENVPIGTAVGITANAFDLDATTNTITYSLTSNPDGLFQIDPNTGVVTTAAAINREIVGASRNITVQASSTDGSTASQSFTITINDLDEFDVTVPSDANATTNNVDENVAIGTTVGITANAFDLDATTSTITYSLTSNPDGLFQIDPNTGIVTTAAAINREVVGASRMITVRASSTDGSTASQSFTIAINDLDEFDVTVPTDTNPAPNNIDENVPIGTAVGITANAFDLDATTNTITYSLTSNPDGLFQIDSSTGVVTTAVEINREIVGASRNITVQASSTDGSTASQSFTITINDLDEFDVTIPTDANSTTNNVNENIAIGTTVGITANAFDLDATTSTITYSLTSNPDGLFQIDPNTGVVTTAAAIDREIAGAIRNITVQASSTDGSTASQSFTIAINDLDEFDVTVPTDTNAAPNNIDENVPIGTTVGITANAFDLDATTSTITYSLTSNPDGLFQIDPNTGVVTTAAAINREIVGASRNITVQASSTDGSTASQSFTITINDLDEFDVTVPTDVDATTNNIDENVAIGTTVGITANAFDLDATTSTITYSLTSNPDGLFQIDPNTGVVTTAAAINREVVGASRMITVRASSTDGSIASQNFTIAINDLDEFDVTVPTDTNPAPNNIDENVAIGTAVGITANAFDLDATTNTITYSLTSNPDGLFQIDSNTGIVTTAVEINREMVGASRNITVRASSTDGSTASQSFTITINDLDEFDVTVPTDVDAATNNVDENVAIGTTVGITANAFDLDATTSTITYSLTSNPDGLFQIDPNTGVVTTAAAINRETTGGSRMITVQASSTDGSTASQIFTIAINDLDEFDVTVPTDTNPAPNNIDENVAIGTAVGITANAFDLDATTSTITYSLTSNPDGLFQIDPNTGVVTTAAAINREIVGASRNITVQASSTDGSTASQSFTITINDLDEFDVTVPTDANATTNNVDENVAIGTTVDITANAFDLDATTSTITYSLTSNPDGLFQIDPNTGIVTTAAAINREVVGASRMITVQASSTDGSTASQTFTISINDLDEFDITSIADDDIAPQSVLENSPFGTRIGITVQAFDQDATQSAITYSLDDDAGGRFAIDAVTGVVTVAAGDRLDYETQTSHSVVVRATSEDGSVTTESFAISVLGVNERPIAIGEQYRADFVTPLTVSFAEMLANDTDPENDSLQIRILAFPSRGSISSLGNGVFVYQPESNFVGTVTILYTVSDGVLESLPQSAQIVIERPPAVIVAPPVDREIPKVVSVEQPVAPATVQTVVAPNELAPINRQVSAIILDQSQEGTPVAWGEPTAMDFIERSASDLDVFTKTITGGIDLDLSWQRGNFSVETSSIQRLQLEIIVPELIEHGQHSFNRLVLPEERLFLESQKRDYFVKTATPIVVGTAIGAGISLHVLMTAHFGSSLLSQSGVFMPLDPLTILEGSAKVKKSKAREDLLFEGVAINDHASK